MVCFHLSAFHPKERGWRVADRIAARNLDAVLLSNHLPIVGALSLLVNTTTLVGIAHTDDDESYAEFQASAPFCCAYAGVSAAITAELKSLRPGDSGCLVRHIPSGVPAATVAERDASEPARFLAVCRLVHRQKRVLDLPPIWRQYRARGGNGSLTICGPGAEESRLREEMAEEIRAGRVTITGAMPLERMAEVYRRHDVLLSVSAYEGLPLTVLEAATAGLYPVLSRTRSGHAEILAVLGEGKLCEIGDTAGFASALGEVEGRLLSVRSLRRIIGERARSRFGLGTMIENYGQLAAEAVELRARDRPKPLPPGEHARRSKADFLRSFLRRWQYRRHYGGLGDFAEAMAERPR